MNSFIVRLKKNDNLKILLVIISGVFLFLSFTTGFKPYGIDFSWVAIIACGAPIFFRSIKLLLTRWKIRVGMLISIAVIACICIKEYFAAGEVVFIMGVGQLLESYTLRRSQKGLKSLLDMKPTTARVFKNNSYTIIDAKDIILGDFIMVYAGETIPVDGEIIEGSTSIDQSIITGESIPVDKEVNDSVFCATTNINGSILIKATKVGENSSIANMIRMIQEARDKKAPIVTIMDRWANYLVFTALFLATIITFITGDIIRGITILVVFCPCALILATPTAISAGIGNATRHGIIIKSGRALEQLGSIAKIVFDKTGTLTKGEPKVNNIFLDKNSTIEEDELLSIAASMELHSEHPLGIAIVNEASLKKIEVVKPNNFITIPGKGAIAYVNKKEVAIGNLNLLKETNTKTDKYLLSQFDKQVRLGNTVIAVSIEKKLTALITLSDVTRESSKSVIKSLKDFNKDISLLTGDNKAVADKISKEIGIMEYKAELLPEDKVKAIEAYKSKNISVCMVGDGINDAPALQTADIGIAMASIGSDIAAKSADIVLIKDEISKLPYLISLSKSVSKKIHFNIAFSLLISSIAITLASFGIIGPISGALIHNASSIFVVFNSAMLLKKNFEVI